MKAIDEFIAKDLEEKAASKKRQEALEAFIEPLGEEDKKLYKGAVGAFGPEGYDGGGCITTMMKVMQRVIVVMAKASNDTPKQPSNKPSAIATNTTESDKPTDTATPASKSVTISTTAFKATGLMRTALAFKRSADAKVTKGGAK
jgi:hypothetical protein